MLDSLSGAAICRGRPDDRYHNRTGSLLARCRFADEGLI